MPEHLEVKLTNTAGIDSFEADFPKGKLTRVKGQSASGKSSILRGIHLAISGPIRPNTGEAIELEYEHLRLHDKSPTGLLRDGSAKAEASVKSGDISWTTTLPKIGAVQGSGNHPATAVMSTYLSPKPTTKIYKSVFEPKAGEEDDFAWITNMSSAENYLAWHQQSSSVQAELLQAMARFGRHIDDVEVARAQVEKFEAQLSQIEPKITEMQDSSAHLQTSSKKKFFETKKIEDDSFRDLQTAEAEVADEEQKHGALEKSLQTWQAKLINAENELLDAEERASEPVEPLDTGELVARLREIEQDLAQATGSDKTAQDAIAAWEQDGAPNLSNSPTLQTWLESRRVPEDLAEKRGEKSEIQSEIVKIQNAHNTAIRRQRAAVDQVASCRGAIAQCNSKIRELTNSMGPAAQANLNDKRKAAASARTAWEEAKAQHAPNKAAMEAATAGNQDLERLEKQKSQLVADKAAAESKAKQTFAFHLPSLGMLPVEEQKFENEEAQTFFSQLDKTGDVEAASTLVERNLGVKGNRLQSLLLEEFELGTLASVLPGILSYSMQKAEEHRSKARDVFNDVGGQLFANLDQSPITTLSLDTDYRLTIMKSDGSQTGVSALSGGESALVACALLMAVQKAYAPEAPVLLIDSVLDNLNNDAKQSLCNFLSEYAAQENIAIVATELADGITTPQLD